MSTDPESRSSAPGRRPGAARGSWLARALGAWLTIVSVAGAPVAARSALAADDSDPSKSGSYCPLPEAGQVARCLEPGQSRYADLFVAVDEEGDLVRAASLVEEDLAGSGEDAYVALSSLAYAYWRLALSAAETEAVDPEVAAKLEEWNELLARVYHQREHDPRFRSALREAAADLEARTPSQQFRPAEGLLTRFDRAHDQLGVRGAVRRVLNRVFEPSDPQPSDLEPSERESAEPATAAEAEEER